ncbi:hypothetical protein [Nocardioides caldifontis]|uniref:hypothetical protein n=1 Tax=Nocardioides caldifontis TaxID=2588938 RepID=UPI0011DF7C47|nr:hypothetical protein [Nocardioides caldifontis]
MSKRFRARAVTTLFALAVSSMWALTGADAAEPASSFNVSAKPSSMAASRGVTLTASAKQVEEGDRFALTAVIKSPAKAATVTLQRWHVPPYFGEPSWQSVKTLRAKRKSKVTFRAVATDLNDARYRVSLQYRDNRKRFVSNATAVTIWRWIPLSEYDPYYETSGLLFGEAAINGIRYVGWGAAYFSHAGTWEARFTPGRHCKAFSGVLGVADVSDDGSSGTVKLTADDQVIYESTPLTPGMDLPVHIPLSKPYRIGIQLFDTSPDAIESWPVIGEPELLCTGV